MILHRIFKIDENHAGLEVSKAYKDYRFPVEMLASGQNYQGIDNTLNKPHGKKELLKYIIKLLSKGAKQYGPFVNQVLQTYSWQDLNDALEILLIDGVIQVIFKNQKPRKSIEWLPKIIKLDPRALEELSSEVPDFNVEFLKLTIIIDRLISHTKNPLKEYILQWIKDVEIKDHNDVSIADRNSFKKYKSIILICAYYVSLKESEQKIPLRYLSNQIWNKPKVLSLYKDDVLFLTGLTLKELDSVLIPDLNGNLDSPLIMISPLEEFQAIITWISNLEVCNINHNEILLSINNMDDYVKTILKLIGVGNSIFESFLLTFTVLKEKLIKENYCEAQLFISNDLDKETIKLRKNLLKIEYVRQQFEFIVLEEIGRGSFAVVYRVFDPYTNKIVACKVLFPSSHFKRAYKNDGTEYILRFKREVKLLSEKLHHENIVTVEKIHLLGSPFWFTMPLANYSLDKWLKNNPKASEEQRIKIFKSIVSGVKYLHGEKKYHRDLAPKNILIYEMGEKLEVKIADFGLAKDPESHTLHTGKSKHGYGHEDFTDPEQLNSLADSTNLSDIYSLGALLFYLLTNKLPKKIKYVHVNCEKVILRAIDRRNRRYQSISEFESELIEFYPNI
ncbi:serine/threonine-protein kinase [Paenibacillus sp. FSL M7-1046]|uniref:serine/threonine-protein kinase n=1 Tax=Paenibacillus sp. FSL M7-1046 TaxID=2975315 RepID=UPI0030FA18B7